MANGRFFSGTLRGADTEHNTLKEAGKGMGRQVKNQCGLPIVSLSVLFLLPL